MYQQNVRHCVNAPSQKIVGSISDTLEAGAQSQSEQISMNREGRFPGHTYCQLKKNQNLKVYRIHYLLCNKGEEMKKTCTHMM